jgi:geranylgeranyl diphosphate synthase type I
MVRYHFGIGTREGQNLTRGKRLRPIFTMLVGQAVGAPPRAVGSMMLAAEMIHAASLAHDDIQDQDVLRWGRPTLWREFGIAHAINVGDGMIAMMYQLLCNMSKQGVRADLTLRAIEIFTEAYLAMVEGQHDDIAHQGCVGTGVAEYLHAIAGKTAAASAAVCQASAVIAGVSARDAVYQIWDDVAGLWKSQDETGKRALQDVARRKATLPILLAIEYGSTLLSGFMSTNARDTDDPESPAEAELVLRELEIYGVRFMCSEYARCYLRRARSALTATEHAFPKTRMLARLVDAFAASTGLFADEPRTESLAAAGAARGVH